MVCVYLYIVYSMVYNVTFDYITKNKELDIKHNMGNGC